VPEGATSSGVSLQRGVIQAEAPLYERVPQRYRELFLAVCSLLESEFGKLIPAKKRERFYEKLADLLTRF